MDRKYKFLLTGLLCSFLFFPFFQTSQAGFFDWFNWFGWFKNSETQRPVEKIIPIIIKDRGSAQKSSSSSITKTSSNKSFSASSKANGFKSSSASFQDKLCAQVITSAKNQITGECKEFSNACIPSGWEKVGVCNTLKNNSSKSSLTSKSSSSVSTSSSKNESSSKSSQSANQSSSSSIGFSSSVSSILTSKLNSCGEITTAGNYILTNNIKSNEGTCLDIHDTNDVYIDCNNYTVWGEKYVSKTKYETENAGDHAIRFKNVSNFSLSSCKLGGEGYVPLKIEKSKNGAIKNNQIGKFYAFSEDSSNLNFQNNNFSWYEQKYSNNVTMRDNVFDPQISKERNLTIFSGVINSSYGSKNKFINNKINGNAEGLFEKQEYADDGIVVEDESDDVIQGNDIKNIWDCGIETVGNSFGTKIVENTIKNAGVCGIGGWYHNSWKDNVVTNNVAQDVPQLFTLFRIYGLRPEGWDIKKRMPRDGLFYFKNNSFYGNKLINPRVKSGKRSSDFNIASPPSLSNIVGERYPSSSEIITESNYFKDNDFGTALNAPLFYPFSMVIDEGGNKCGGTQNKEGGSVNDYPIKCLQ